MLPQEILDFGRLRSSLVQFATTCYLWLQTVQLNNNALGQHLYRKRLDCDAKLPALASTVHACNSANNDSTNVVAINTAIAGENAI